MPPARRIAAALRTPTLLLALLASFAALRPARVHAQMCEQQGLAVCSYGKYYSGTITWKSTRTITGDISGVLKGEVTATVDRGRVSCTGQMSEDKQIKPPQIPSTYAASGTISGAGLIVIEKPSSSPTDTRGTYKIEVACPTPATTWTTKSRDGSNSGSTPSDPAEFKGGEYALTTVEHPTPDFALLAGGETYEHPDTDPANGVSGTFTITWRLTSGPLVVKAVPGGPYTVARGEPLALDGSASQGNNLQYTWTFAPTGCPPNASGAAGTKKEGGTPTVTLLCSATVTLTVTDGTASDSKTVAAVVKPRDWKTPFSHWAKEGRVEGGGRPFIQDSTMVGGQNACALDPSAPDHTFHPAATATDSSWDNLAYELRQVIDPGGPFDGYWYVGKYDLRLERQTLVNKYLLPGAPPPLSNTKSFYEANKEAGTDVDAYLAAIRAHEGMGSAAMPGHSGRMKRALATADPARKVEALIANGAREGLKKKVDAEVRAAEVVICKASSDPLPEIWRGRLAFVRVDTGVWIKILNPVVVGGPGYGAPMSCD